MKSHSKPAAIRLSPKRKEMIRTFVLETHGRGKEFGLPNQPRWLHQLWEFMHERDSSIHLEDVRRWKGSHASLFKVEHGGERQDGSSTGVEDRADHRGQYGGNRGGYAQPAHNSSSSSSEGPSGMRIINSYPLAPTPTLSVPGSSTSSVFSDEASMYPSRVSSDMTNGGDLDPQYEKKKLYQTAFEAIQTIHEVCLRLPEVKTCLMKLEEISKAFHRNHHKLIFPVGYNEARSVNPNTVKMEAYIDSRGHPQHMGAEMMEAENSSTNFVPAPAGDGGTEIETISLDSDPSEDAVGNSSNGLGTGAIADSSPDDKLYCFCAEFAYGQMIACDNTECPIEWFHLECVGLSSIPQGDWLCSVCQRPSLQK